MKRTALLSVSIIATLLNNDVHAQTNIAPPEFQTVDKNGIDLLSGSASFSINLGSIGSGIGEMSFEEYWSNGGRIGNSLNNVLYFNYNDRTGRETATVTFGNSSSEYNHLVDGSFVKLRSADGSTLIEAANGQSITHTLKDGEIRIYGVPPGQSGYAGHLLLSRILPNGVIWSYEWQVHQIFGRPISATNNLGYKIGLTYLSDTPPNVQGDLNPNWGFISLVNFYNLAAGSNPLLIATQSKSGSAPQEVITAVTTGGQTWSVSGNAAFDPNYPGAQPFTYKTPSASSSNFSFLPVGLTNGMTGAQRSVVFNGITTNYVFSLSSNAGITTVTDPLGNTTELRYTKYTSPYSSAAFPTRITDANGNATILTAQGYLINSVTRPEGDQDIFQRDGRTNITLVTHKAKPGSGLTDTTEAAVFPSGCTNMLTCNRPTSYTDRKGQTTLYSYAPEHGGLLTETLPPDSTGIQPVKRYSYTQRYSWISDGSGSYVRSSTGVWLKTEERSCLTTATTGNTCSGGSADEVVTTYDYGPDSGPSNLSLRGIVATSNGQTQRTCFTYDEKGNTLSETRPLGTGGNCP